MQRRDFIQACALLGVGSVSPLLSGLAWGRAAAAQPVVVNLFLRGGADGLHLLAPAEDPAYIASRPPALRVEASGPKAGTRLNNADTKTGPFYLNGDASPLLDLYSAGKLAFVHAVGLRDGTRSHFVAQELVEKGVSRSEEAGSALDGWLARAAQAGPGGALLYSSADLGVNAFSGAATVLNGRKLDELVRLPSGAATEMFLGELATQGNDLATRSISNYLSMMGRIRPALERQEPLAGPARGGKKSTDPLDEALDTVAQLIDMDVGLSTACVDLGGWDTHEGQAGRMDRLLQQLSNGLAGFMNRASQGQREVIVLVMTEFGRRFRSNLSGGTDHGHGACWMVLGTHLRGGRVLGQWPGLENHQLDRGVDLAVTTDYRSVCAAVLARQGGKPEKVFPTWDSSQKIALF